MEDDRLVGRVAEIQSGVLDELIAVTKVGGVKALARVCGLDAAYVRAQSILANCIGAAFLDLNVFKIFGELPWRLADGDVDENLDKFIEAPQPQEETAANIHTVNRIGYPRREVREAVELFQEMPTSATPLE